MRLLRSQRKNNSFQFAYVWQEKEEGGKKTYNDRIIK